MARLVGERLARGWGADAWRGWRMAGLGLTSCAIPNPSEPTIDHLWPFWTRWRRSVAPKGGREPERRTASASGASACPVLKVLKAVPDFLLALARIPATDGTDRL